MERVGALWVKRDDRSSELYGGNKVRKLELLLGAARDAGKSRVVTLGAVGSHQVVATAIYGAPVISEWLIGFGTGFADHAYFLVFTGSIDTPPTIGWTCRTFQSIG